jgi:cytochrome c oxidase assembly protein subunit 15
VTATRNYRMVSRLGLATTVLMFALMVIGSVVRTTGSGLACPDWPLCGGRLLPPLEFHVLIEWTHRLVALLVSVLLLGTIGWTLSHAATRSRLGGLAALAVVLLAAQVLLGALTVWKLLSPAIVGSHLGVALLLFCTVLSITLGARDGATASAPPGRTGPPAPGGPGGTAFGLTTLAAFGQCLLGGTVSATHAAAACRDWPTCNGTLFPPLQGLVGIQMLHRYGAYTLVLLVLVLALRARRAADPRVRVGAAWALGLVVLEAVLGVGNLVMGTPPWLTALHLATAVTLVAALLTVTLGTRTGPAPTLELVLAEAR